MIWGEVEEHCLQVVCHILWLHCVAEAGLSILQYRNSSCTASSAADTDGGVVIVAPHQLMPTAMLFKWQLALRERDFTQ